MDTPAVTSSQTPAVARNQIPTGARSQHGVLSRAQALQAGIGDETLRWMVRCGRWQRLHRGVYLTHSGPVTWEQRCWAALLHAGTGAVLALDAAAYLWGMSQTRPQMIHVAVPHERRPLRAVGMRVSRRRQLISAQRRGFPVTSAAQTLVDNVHRQAGPDDAVALLARAVQRGVILPAEVVPALAGRRVRHRKALLGALVEVTDGAESLVEARLVTDVIRAHGLPELTRQVPLPAANPEERPAGRRDGEFVGYRVGFEVDGRAYHAGEAFHSDRRRDRRALGSGVLTVRAGGSEILTTPCEVALDTARVLRRAGWRGMPYGCSARCPVGRVDWTLRSETA